MFFLSHYAFVHVGKLKNTDVRLFRTPGAGRRKRQSPDDIPLFFEDLNITDAQRMTCEGNRECIYDLVVTGDPEIAMATLNDQRETNETREVIRMLIYL